MRFLCYNIICSDNILQKNREEHKDKTYITGEKNIMTRPIKRILKNITLRPIERLITFDEKYSMLNKIQRTKRCQLFRINLGLAPFKIRITYRLIIALFHLENQ